MESKVKVNLLAAAANVFALGALVVAVLLFVNSRPQVVYSEDDTADARMEIAESALMALENRIVRLEEKLDDTSTPVESGEVPPDVVGARDELRTLQERLTHLESLMAGAEAEPTAIGAAHAASTVQAAAERYRQMFMDPQNGARMRGEALEVMARFPETYAAVNDQVMGEIGRIMSDPSSDPGLVTKIVNVVRTRDWSGATGILLVVAEGDRFPRSARSSAIVGLRRRLAEPGVRAGLASLRAATGDERIQQAIDEVLSGKLERPHK